MKYLVPADCRHAIVEVLLYELVVVGLVVVVVAVICGEEVCCCLSQYARVLLTLLTKGNVTDLAIH